MRKSQSALRAAKTDSARPATIRDIARRAGITPASVSRILNHLSNFSAGQATRDKVLGIAKELNYRPRRAARSLVTGKSYMVSVILDTLEHDFVSPTFAQSFGEMIRILWQSGYTTSFLPVANSASLDEAVLQTLRESHADGYFVPRAMLLPRTLEELRARKVPVVSFQLSLTPQDPDLVSYVEMDEAPAACDLVRELVRIGHREFVCFGPLSLVPTRFDAFQAALKSLAPDAIFRALSYQPAGTGPLHDRREAYFEAKLRIPEIRGATAILCTSDLVAWGMIDALREVGLEPGRDVTVTGQDNLEENPGVLPAPRDVGLTTIDRNAVGRGQAIAELLLDRIRSPAETPITRFVPMKVIYRKTHGPVPR
ncbi:MAG: LacI family DNA-binding transcriptional regulator [Kiritimatiellia bacterium]|nr:LacI family DNA-binding transcriptional regulator [Kiritimatiellia bacterium]